MHVPCWVRLTLIQLPTLRACCAVLSGACYGWCFADSALLTVLVCSAILSGALLQRALSLSLAAAQQAQQAQQEQEQGQAQQKPQQGQRQARQVKNGATLVNCSNMNNQQTGACSCTCGVTAV
jgi:hypothetical protein